MLQSNTGRIARIFFLSVGLMLTGVGIVGAFLPLLPSTIFFILAALCFARSSPRLERWLNNHPVFGPPIKDWRDHRAISRGSKIVACVSMAAGLGLFFWRVEPSIWLALIVTLTIVLCALYVASRPEA